MNIVLHQNKIFEIGTPKVFDYSIDRTGFVLAPFDPVHDPLFYPVSGTLASLPENLIENNYSDVPFISHDKEQYREYVDAIKSALNGREDKKIVASRRETFSFTKSLREIYDNLFSSYPDSCVFLLSTSQFGTWIGASPELLLKKEEDSILSMSLAGTRPADSPEPWDLKNIMEQEIVTAYITDIFKGNGINVKKGRRVTRKAGNIEHLMTPIIGNKVGNADINRLLKTLSPTPALAGFPKSLALDTIRRFEGERSLYGGFFGFVNEDGDFTFNVILRCAMLKPSGEAVLFAGGGVTAHSDPDMEWEETIKKFETIKRFI